MDLYLRPHSAARSRRVRDRDRELTKPTVSPAAPLAWPRAAASKTATAGSLQLRNCRLYDRDGLFDVGVENGLITSVAEHGTKNGLGPSTDVKGAYLLPGFCDAHVHLLPGGERLRALQLDDIGSLEELRRVVSEFVQEHPDKSVIRAFGLEPGIVDTEKARSELDNIVETRPLVILSPDLHTIWVNGKALADSKLDRKLEPLPQEFEELGIEDLIELDDDGFPTGELREPQSYFLVDGALRENYPDDFEERLAALQAAVKHLNSHGITSVHNMGLALPEEDVELLLLALELDSRERLTLRIHSSYSIVPDRFMLEDVVRAAELRDLMNDFEQGRKNSTELRKALLETLSDFKESSRYQESSSSQNSQFYSRANRSHLKPYEDLESSTSSNLFQWNQKLTMRAIKLFTDGVIRQNTAYRSDAEPGDSIPVFAPEELERVVELADKLSLQVRAHAIGDRAVHMMLNAVEQARRTHEERDAQRGHQVRHRVEHIELCQDDDLPRFKALRVVPSMQPLHYSPYPDEFYEKVSRALWDLAYPWRSLQQQGAPPAFSSDWPIASCDCLQALRRVINRKPFPGSEKSQSLSVRQAIGSFTQEGAKAVHQEHRVGKVEEGYLADLVILTSDDLKNAEVETTIFEGRIVYSR